jgi:hypothetical protein
LRVTRTNRLRFQKRKEGGERENPRMGCDKEVLVADI